VFLTRRALQKAKLLNDLQVIGDGDEAVAYLAGQDRYGDRQRYPMPALVLLDLKLPRRSGLEVLEWIRAQPRLKRLPVVLLTSSKEQRDINTAFDLAVSSFIVKPVDPEQLVGLLKTLHVYWLVLNESPEVNAT
jgi:CheY-like chemotaxis protein